MSQPRVTIITPCYNGEAFIDKYFASVLAQTYPNLELIFVNDGSVDHTERVALSYKKALAERGIVYKYLYQENGGQAKALNAGMKEMTGEYMVWPDSDDLLTPDSIEKRVRYLELHRDCAMVRSNAYVYDYASGKPLRRISNRENRFKTDIFLDLILEETFCCCGCYMLRVDALRTIYPDFHIYESPAGQNWQILIPMAGKYPCGYIDEDLYLVMQRPDSHSRQVRSLEQTLTRYDDLRKILEESIALSGRQDLNYEEIVDTKYLKIFLLTYLQFNSFEGAERCYAGLKRKGEVDGYEVSQFLKKVHPIKYECQRVIGRMKRITQKMITKKV